MILLVTYDLKSPGKDYESLYNLFKAADSWWHYLDSTWIIKTTESTQVWSDRIKRAIDTNDEFLVVDITKRSRQGWLPTKAWEWIRNNE